MSFNIVTVPTSAIPQSASNFKRPTSSYHPTIWGDTFLPNAQQTKAVDASVIHEHECLKQEVKRMLMNQTWKPSQELRFIDAIQRLGVGYHFESDIDEKLSKYISHDNNGDEDDLYCTALRFRLLRQQGIRVSSDIFEKFKDDNGDFRASLVDDVPGMLSLYEATFLGIRGEAILDEALAFTIKNLQLALDHLNPSTKEMVTRALDRPIRKWLTRLEARHYLTIYGGEEWHNETLLKFAKLDFNLLQQLHQKELSEITLWWRSLNVSINFPYARDRIVECFFWMSGVSFEPQYTLARKMATKITAVASILDDTYDNYATLGELELFTEAIRRWDIKEVDMLPEYMRKLYKILIDLYADCEEETAMIGMPCVVYYAKEVMKAMLEAYLCETKWRDEGYVPTMEEYLPNSIISSGIQMLAASSFLGMGKVATKEAFDWILHLPKIVKAASIVARFMNDMVSSKLEQSRNHVASAVECYMKQHDVPKEEVIKALRREVALAWKDINEELLIPTTVPMPLLDRVLNLARSIDVIYKDEDGYTNCQLLKDHVSSVLKDPVY